MAYTIRREDGQAVDLIHRSGDRARVTFLNFSPKRGVFAVFLRDLDGRFGGDRIEFFTGSEDRFDLVHPSGDEVRFRGEFRTGKSNGERVTIRVLDVSFDGCRTEWQIERAEAHRRPAA